VVARSGGMRASSGGLVAGSRRLEAGSGRRIDRHIAVCGRLEAGAGCRRMEAGTGLMVTMSSWGGCGLAGGSK
jgi:hypothetical protein